MSDKQNPSAHPLTTEERQRLVERLHDHAAAHTEDGDVDREESPKPAKETVMDKLTPDGSRMMTEREIADAEKAAKWAKFDESLETTIAAQPPRIQEKVAALLAERQEQAKGIGGGRGGPGQHA